MKHFLTTIVLIFSVLLLSRCSKPSCFENAGVLTSTARSVSPFHQIDLYDNIHLVLTQDTVESITVEAQERLQPNISATIANGVLTIKNHTTCNWLRKPSEKVKIHVSVKQLEHLNYHGSGEVTSTNMIVADKIKLYSSTGAGKVHLQLNARHTEAIIEYESADFILKGKSDYCYTYTNARGSIDLRDLEVRSMLVWYAGVRNAIINVTEKLEVTVFHTGNVYYKGTPTIIGPKYYSTGKIAPFP